MSRGVRQPASSHVVMSSRAHNALRAWKRLDHTAPDRTVPFAPTAPREDETSVQRGGSARLWSRNHLVDVVGEIAQSKSGSIPRPVPTCRNGRYFYCTCHDQRRSDGRSCLNFSRFHFSSLSSPLKPPFRDDDGARIAPSAQTPPKRWRSQGRDGASIEAGRGARRIVRQPVQLGVKKERLAHGPDCFFSTAAELSPLYLV